LSSFQAGGTKLERFLPKNQHTQMEIFLFCVITFEQFKIQTYSVPQNDHLNLSFVKYIKVAGKKKARNGHKTDFCQ
jgi:hypothetical protein